MKKQWAIAAVGFCLLVAVALLWLRVRELERSVDVLTRQVQSKPGVIAVRANEPEQPDDNGEKKIFKLIDSAPSNDEASEIGVPWSVEHGMMIDAAEHATPHPEAQQSPQWKNNDDGPRIELREQLFGQPPKSILNDGEFN